MLRRAERLPRFAFVSQVTQGYLSVDLPPHQHALFAHADVGMLGLSGVFALSPSGIGQILSLGTSSLLNLCEVKADAGPAYQLCAATPSVLKAAPATALPGKAERHRKLLLKQTSSHLSKFTLEVLK